MQQIVLIVHFFTCISLIVLVLIQHGKGADIGAAFGSGASTTLFGSQGSSSFLLRMTSFLAAIFFTTSIVLGYVANKHVKKEQILPIPTNIQQPVSMGLTDDAASTNTTMYPIEEENNNAAQLSLPEETSSPKKDTP